MIYIVKGSILGAQKVWRLEGANLVESGDKPVTWRLADLRTARITPTDARRAVPASLSLAFPRKTIVIGARHFEGLLGMRDQSRAFAAFARAVLARAAREAPNARYETRRTGRIAGVYLGAMAILAVGLALILVATVVAGAATLGIELGARLSFALLLMAATWPWIGRLYRQTFDPRDVPPSLLPV